MERLTQIKRYFKENQISGLSLDIDETLSVTVKPWFAMMNEQFGNPEGLSAEELRAKYIYTRNVPYWQSAEATDFIQGLRSNDAIHETMPLIEGADAAVQKISKIIPVVLYPTVRPDIVTSGTEKWLRTNGFPKAPVFARPADVPYEMGNQWKAGVLEELYPYVRGIVDDNVGLANFLSSDYQGVVFVYNSSDHPGKCQNIIPCPSWQDVVNNVKTYFSK